jgi:hypothetical protein
MGRWRVSCEDGVERSVEPLALEALVESIVLLSLLSVTLLAIAVAAQSAAKPAPAPAPSAEALDEARWVREIGPLLALELVERELRAVASATPLPGMADMQVGIERRYRVCRRQLRAIGNELRHGDERARSIAALLESSPPAGLQVSPTVRAYESRQVVLAALDRLRDVAA